MAHLQINQVLRIHVCPSGLATIRKARFQVKVFEMRMRVNILSWNTDLRLLPSLWLTIIQAFTFCGISIMHAPAWMKLADPCCIRLHTCKRTCSEDLWAELLCTLTHGMRSPKINSTQTTLASNFDKAPDTYTNTGAKPAAARLITTSSPEASSTPYCYSLGIRSKQTRPPPRKIEHCMRHVVTCRSFSVAGCLAKLGNLNNNLSIQIENWQH